MCIGDARRLLLSLGINISAANEPGSCGPRRPVHIIRDVARLRSRPRVIRPVYAPRLDSALDRTSPAAAAAAATARPKCPPGMSDTLIIRAGRFRDPCFCGPSAYDNDASRSRYIIILTCVHTRRRRRKYFLCSQHP